MIQANELRIGNWVDDSKGILYQIKRSDFELTDFNITMPIPLTPEILEKCGFKMHLTYLLWEKDNFYLRRYLIPDNEYCFKHGAFTSKSISHLHQLQNLYFALTGEELTVNL